MSKVRAHIATSLDGYVAGPNQSQEEPLGEGGEGLHDWLVALKSWREQAGMEGGEENVSNDVFAEVTSNVGAEIMGRGKFGPPSRGPWGDDPWQGWWGDHPPFHKPVFVVTHYERDPLTLSDTTFTFVTYGIESALAQARDSAGDRDGFLGGGRRKSGRARGSNLVRCVSGGLAGLEANLRGVQPIDDQQKYDAKRDMDRVGSHAAQQCVVVLFEAGRSPTHASGKVGHEVPDYPQSPPERQQRRHRRAGTAIAGDVQRPDFLHRLIRFPEISDRDEIPPHRPSRRVLHFVGAG
jgi:dihydrofolate reductase